MSRARGYRSLRAGVASTVLAMLLASLAGGTLASPHAGALPADSVGGSPRAAPAHLTPALVTNPPLTSELDLLNEGSLVSPSLVFDGFLNSRDSAFPVVLTGAQATVFWPPGKSVLELAPSFPAGHDSGVALFPSPGSSTVTIQITGVDTSAYSLGDGLEVYLFASPLTFANWSIPYYATDPEGANGTFVYSQGSVIFPYSTTAYMVVQWDPALGNGNTITLYLVDPISGGSVTPLSIQAVTLGGGSGALVNGDYVTLSVAYTSATSVLSGTVLNYNTGVVVSSFISNLSSMGFDPTYVAGHDYVFGAGASGNHTNGWGLLYLGFGPGGTSSSGSNPYGALGATFDAFLIGAVVVIALILGILIGRAGRRHRYPPPPG
jgi:hypothetical protein